MSVSVYIDDKPAERSEAYLGALSKLGAVPNESENRFELWTSKTPPRVTSRSVWLTPSTVSERLKWLKGGGAILQSHAISDGTEDWLFQGYSRIKVRCAVPMPINPGILAAFLVHDFPLVDAMMLARAYRGSRWPTNLSDYPAPLGGPTSPLPFPSFPRSAGLYAVVPTSDWVRCLAQENVPVLQLRDKRTNDVQRRFEVRKAVEAVAATGALLFINDDWRLAVEDGAYGVHLGQEDIAKADLGAIQQAGLRLGISTHGIYEMLCAHACKPSYMALGAIYATTTKAMPTVPQGIRRLKHYVRLMSPHCPLVAIGGIDLSRIAGVWATGVDSAAVLRAILNAEDYRRAVANLMATKPQINSAAEAA
jgi:thiamine-phosphate pyrophosphorylase